MEQNTLAQLSKNGNTYNPQCAAFLALPPKVQARATALAQRYGSRFLDVCACFPSMNKGTVVASLEDAVGMQAPTLIMVDKTWGEGASVYWLEVQLAEVMMFLGIRDKLTPYQRNALAKLLRQEAYERSITLAEMMIFFSRFENGYYKTFQGYERPNPQVVTKSFAMFKDDLMEMRCDMAEREDNIRKRKEREEEGMKSCHGVPQASMDLYKKLVEDYNSKHHNINK